jgi:hypothetical protein
MTYPWYIRLSDSENDLQQGDLIPNCPILIPPENLMDGENQIDFHEIDSIILTQSCDLTHGKVEIVLVCPYTTLTEFIASLGESHSTEKAQKKVADNLRKGYLPGYHLLNKDSDIDLTEDYLVVDFRNVYGIQFNSLSSIVESMQDRIRLLPPYREHLSQAFARYFMRVGLPQDIIFK